MLFQLRAPPYIKNCLKTGQAVWKELVPVGSAFSYKYSTILLEIICWIFFNHCTMSQEAFIRLCPVGPTQQPSRQQARTKTCTRMLGVVLCWLLFQTCAPFWRASMCNWSKEIDVTGRFLFYYQVCHDFKRNATCRSKRNLQLSLQVYAPSCRGGCLMASFKGQAFWQGFTE